jgi:hypothetical protein
MIGFIGDVHGHFDDMFNIIAKHPEVTRWFQVGDLGDKSLSYPEFPSNFHFIQGNHENWDAIQAYKDSSSPSFIKNGSVLKFEDDDVSYKVGVLGGNYAPSFYTKQKLSGERRRHFLEREVETLLANASTKLDILITHEAPVPYQKDGRELGQPIISDIISRTHPDAHFFGHHHYYSVRELEGTISVGLTYPGYSYVLYDVSSGRVKKLDVS